MDLEQLIKEHAELLECRAQKNPALCEKLKQLSPAAKPQKKLLLPLTPLAFLYSFAVLALTFINFQLIGLAKKVPPPQRPSVMQAAEIFQPSFPGSISQVIEEVIAWDE